MSVNGAAARIKSTNGKIVTNILTAGNAGTENEATAVDCSWQQSSACKSPFWCGATGVPLERCTAWDAADSATVPSSAQAPSVKSHARTTLLATQRLKRLWRNARMSRIVGAGYPKVKFNRGNAAKALCQTDNFRNMIINKP